MGRSTLWLRATGAVVFSISILSSGPSFAQADDPASAAKQASEDACVGALKSPPATKKSAKAKATPTPTVALGREWRLANFLSEKPEDNLALQHPLSLANAAEKTYAHIMHAAPRQALDPVYRVKPTTIYPMLSGEHEASGGRMVVGQEAAVEKFVDHVHSAARGDRVGKSLGFPGPAGTGKTELMYVLDNLAKNLGKLDKYKEYSYYFENLHKIPYLKAMFKWGPDGKPMVDLVKPDLARSPFTLLRSDMQDRILSSLKGKIQNKWGITIANGWTEPEPKSDEILRAIFEFEDENIKRGLKTVDDLSEEEYLKILEKYVVIVPKTYIKPPQKEPGIIRAQQENPNFQALFVQPNLGRINAYGQKSALGVDYTGKIPQTDGGPIFYDELFRNGGELLNINLEIIQNQIMEVDFGRPLHMDTLVVWNSNDESIQKAGEDNAIKALMDRTESKPMRSLLHPNQIEAVLPFQIKMDQFKIRKLDETGLRPFVHSEVYPPTNEHGQTFSAQGRYALYYDMDGSDILIAPYTLNYIAWLAAATRLVHQAEKIAKFEGELNLVRANPSLFTDAINRVKIMLGDRVVERADLMELSRLRELAEEGMSGIGARRLETWVKAALSYAKKSGRGVLTPNMVDKIFPELLDGDKTFRPDKAETRAEWLSLRQQVKLQILLPKLDQDVKKIVSGDANKAERMYDQVEKEFIALAQDPDAKTVTPEDGSQVIYIRHSILAEIRQIYREKFGRDFQISFLLSRLPGARRGAPINRDPDLLEAIRVFISNEASTMADYIAAFDSFYRGGSSDPNIRERAAEIEPVLSKYGYDLESFKEAVALTTQLQAAERMDREMKRQR
jgi:predicted Ser/Thr protein kinase